MGGLGTSPLIDFTEAAVWQIRDTISIQKGSHLIKTGIELRHQFPHKEGDRNTNEFGRWDFTGNFTGYDFGDLLPGLPFRTKIEAITPRAEARDWEFGPKSTRCLTCRSNNSPLFTFHPATGHWPLFT